MPTKKTKPKKTAPKKAAPKKQKFEEPNHVLIPKHSKLKDKEKKQLLEKYKIEETNLPKILAKDPGIAHLSLEPGDVVKIVRKSPTAGETIFYRVVV